LRGGTEYRTTLVAGAERWVFLAVPVGIAPFFATPAELCEPDGCGFAMVFDAECPRLFGSCFGRTFVEVAALRA
jgi:hypothetical protein